MTAGEEFLTRQLEEEEVADVQELPLAELKEQAQQNAIDNRTEDAFQKEKIEATEEPPLVNGEPKPL
ncbi:MAG: hypothetical protein DI536_24180 [Archangium gephyra]|uniref:Uncharacterized protein n=1 Tax=Archangium gephyra TaxID=48 RepID=A0A2W5T3K5_9BACT|nr:MAG: hypothetical protein DI536_24180 [Archangium gephyra]